MERERRIRRRSVSQHWENIADRLRCGEDKVGTADGACLDVQMRRGYSADRGQGWSSIPYQTTMSQFCRSHGANQQSTKHAEEDTRGDLQCHAVHPETEVPGKKNNLQKSKKPTAWLVPVWRRTEEPGKPNVNFFYSFIQAQNDLVPTRRNVNYMTVSSRRKKRIKHFLYIYSSTKRQLVYKM